MSALPDSLDAWLGLHAQAQDLTFVQISLRGILVFMATLLMVRVGDRRFLSKKTIFDAVLGFILASMLARAVNGTAAFFPTLGGACVLIALHKVLAAISRRSHWFGGLVKGMPERVIRGGEVDHRVMVRHDVSEHDLMEDLRLNGNVATPAEVQEAYIERNGQISVVKAERPAARGRPVLRTESGVEFS